MKKQYFIMSIFLMLIFTSCSKQEKRHEITQQTSSIEEINKKFKNINSIYYENINYFFTNSEFYYEKPNVLMFKTYFLSAKKAEIVLDKNFFWFWMEQFDENSAYFCDIKNLNKTRIKKSLNPLVLKNLIWIDEIKNYKIILNQEETIKLEIKEEEYVKTLEIKNNNIIKQEIKTEDGLILTVCVVEFQKIEETNVPKIINVIWHEENKEEKINLGLAKINKKINITQIPKNLNKINLENY